MVFKPLNLGIISHERTKSRFVADYFFAFFLLFFNKKA